MIATEVIKTKRNNGELSFEQIDSFVNGYVEGQVPDYQMSSLLMAIFLNGMTEAERLNLTKVMLESGQKVQFDSQLFPVDKHSTGGVGDKTSLILAPLVAACGVPVPMMSGRGLGHTGGTLDKLESIPGFNVFLSLDKFKEQTEKLGLCFIGQTKDICPADKLIYSLRDVTATVESLPLICASIMSKKIAEGIRGLVLDVKFGSGAFMKTLDEARALAKGLTSIGEGYGLQTRALLTNMNQPLGRMVGNSIEVGECISIMKREDFRGLSYKSFSDTEELSVLLAVHMVSIGKNISQEQATAEVSAALDSGKAYELFERVVETQGGKINALPSPTQSFEIMATEDGFLSEINTERVGVAGICLGAGRKTVNDTIDPVAGIELAYKVGDPIQKGTPLFRILTGGSQKGVPEATEILNDCFKISAKKPDTLPLVAEEL